MNRTRRILFPVIALMIVPVTLGLIEGIFRITLPGLTPDLLHETTFQGEDYWRINRKYLERYFPSNVSTIPELKPTVFRQHKGDSTFRIVCLGGSSMFGTPYQMNATIPAMVRTYLRHSYPNRHIEVINLAASAINTNVIVHLLDDIKRMDPDLVLLYAGHNEYYGPDGISTNPVVRTFPWLVQLTYRMHDVAIFSGLRSLFLPVQQQSQKSLMAQVSQGKEVALDSDDDLWIAEQFSRNLEAIFRSLLAEGIPVIASEVTSNPFFPPFIAPKWPDDIAAKMTIDSLQAQRDYQEVVRLLTNGRSLYSSHASILYNLGLAYDATGQLNSAAIALGEARENDLLPFRARRRINSVIRDQGNLWKVPVISPEPLLSMTDSVTLPEASFFWEHLHLTADGYQIIARAFVQQIIRMDLLHEAPSKDPEQGPPEMFIPWLDLAYADLSMQMLTSHWPFTDYPAQLKVVPTANDRLVAVARDVYSRSLTWDDGMLKTATTFRSIGDLASAEHTYRAILQDFEMNPYALYLLAGVQRDRGDLEAAGRSYQRSIHLDASYPYAHIEYALLLINHGEFEQAERSARKALELSANGHDSSLMGTIHYALAGIDANNGDLQGALEECVTSLTYNPSYEPPRTLRDNILRFMNEKGAPTVR